MQPVNYATAPVADLTIVQKLAWYVVLNMLFGSAAAKADRKGKLLVRDNISDTKH